MLRKIPRSFSQEYREVLQKLTFSRTAEVVGSMGEKDLLYAADVDLMDRVVLSSQKLQEVKQKVFELERMPNARVSDVKCGIIEDWMLLQTPHIEGDFVVGYSREKELAHLDLLYGKGVISLAEHRATKKLLRQELTPVEFLMARKEVRFGLIRWTLAQLKDGRQTLRDGTEMTLLEACKTSPLKVDVIVFLDRRVVEFSSIVFWTKENGHPWSELPNYAQAIREDILLYSSKGNWFKTAKRMYLLAKLFGNDEVVSKLREMFNSELGFLYVVVADLEMLREVKSFDDLNQTEKQTIKDALDELRMKYAKLPTTRIVPKVSDFQHLKSLLQEEARKELEDYGFYPIPKKYTP